jgi:hypothetical protein
MREVPLRRELQQRQAVALRDRPQRVEALGAALDPARRAELAVVALGHRQAGAQVVVEEAAVVEDAREDLHVMGRGRRQRQLTGPWLERVEDQHRPVDDVAVALEAVDDVEGEAVGRTGRDADAACEASVAQRDHALPDRLVRVAGAVGVVEQQQVERVGADALEAALGGVAQVGRVLARSAQARVGEARKALGALALAVVEVVADGADQRVGVAVEAGERAAEQRVGCALAVDVGGQHGPDALVGAHEREQPLVIERDAVVHEVAARPCAEGGVRGIEGHRPEGYAGATNLGGSPPCVARSGCCSPFWPSWSSRDAAMMTAATRPRPSRSTPSS